MKVVLDKEAGFCFGVKRSADLVFSAPKDKKVQILGELIHNQDFISDLNVKGIETKEKYEELTADIVVIRAHGLPKELEVKIRKNFEVIDATCPFVKKIHKLVSDYSKLGYKIVLLGERNHAEVVGCTSYAPEVFVVTRLEDLPEFKTSEKVLLVSQTTQKKMTFEMIEKALRKKYKNLVVKDTICDATSNKQQSVKELSKQVDLMLVIGGKNSCNTNNLYEIARNEVTTYKIENANELDRSWLNNEMTVGITAGASTPDYVIKEVYNILITKDLNKVGIK